MTAPIVDTALLIPVGHPLGAFVDPELKSSGYRVRVGPDVVPLSPARFAVWALAHSSVEQDPASVWGRNQVLTAAAGMPLTEDPEEQIEALLDDGLLAEIEPGTVEVAGFCAAHRLVPLMLGLGNSAEDPGVFNIGLPGRPVVSVSGFLYDLYEWGHLSTDLAAAVTSSIDTVRSDLGVQDEPTIDDPAALLDAVVRMLHLLLAPNAVYLDTRRTG